jgi:hypothetical protein
MWDAIHARNPEVLRRLRYRWFDWHTETWRDDHEVWMRSRQWMSAPQYGGRLFVRRAKAAPSSSPRLCIRRTTTHGKAPRRRQGREGR